MKTTTFLAASAILAGAFVDIAYGAPFPSIPNPDATNTQPAKVFEVDFGDGRAPIYVPSEKRHALPDIDNVSASTSKEEPTVVLDHYLDPEFAAKLAPEIFTSSTSKDDQKTASPRYLDPELAVKLAPEIFQSSTSNNESAVVATRSPAMGPIDEGLTRELLFGNRFSVPLYKAIICEMIKSPLSQLPGLQQQEVSEFCKRSDVDAISEMDVATQKGEISDTTEKDGDIKREGQTSKYPAGYHTTEKTISARTPLNPWGRPTTNSPLNAIVDGYKHQVANQLAWQQQNPYGRINHHGHGPSSRSIDDQDTSEQQPAASLSARMIPFAAKEVGVDLPPAETLTARDIPSAAKKTKPVKTPKVEKPETVEEVQAKASFKNFMNAWQQTLTFLQDVTTASQSFVDKIDSKSDVENSVNSTSAMKAPGHVVDTHVKARRSGDEPYEHIDPAVLFWWEGKDFSYVDTEDADMEVVARFFAWLNSHQDRFPKPSEVPKEIVDIAEIQTLMTDEQKYFFWKWVHEQEGQMSTTEAEKAQWAQTSPTQAQLEDSDFDGTPEDLADRWGNFKQGLRDAKDGKSKLHSRDFIGPINPMPYGTPVSDATDAARMAAIDKKMQAQPWYHNPQWKPSPEETEDESLHDEDAASYWWDRSITEQTPTEQPPAKQTEEDLSLKLEESLDREPLYWTKRDVVQPRHEERGHALTRRFDMKNEYNDEYEYVPLSPAQQEEERTKTMKALEESFRYPTRFSRLKHDIAVTSQRILDDLIAATSSPVGAEDEETLAQEEFDNPDENYKHGERKRLVGKREGGDKNDPHTDAGFDKYWQDKMDELWDQIRDISNHYPDPFPGHGGKPKPKGGKGNSKRGVDVDDCELGESKGSDIVKRQHCIHRDGAFPNRPSPAEVKDIHDQFSKFKWPRGNHRSWAPASDKDVDISEEDWESMPVIDVEISSEKQEKRYTSHPRPSNGHIEGDDDLSWSERFDTASNLDDESKEMEPGVEKRRRFPDEDHEPCNFEDKYDSLHEILKNIGSADDFDPKIVKWLQYPDYPSPMWYKRSADTEPRTLAERTAHKQPTHALPRTNDTDTEKEIVKMAELLESILVHPSSTPSTPHLTHLIRKSVEVTGTDDFGPDGLPPHLILFHAFNWLCREFWLTLQSLLVNPYSEYKIEQRVKEKLGEMRAAAEESKDEVLIAKGKEMEQLENALTQHSVAKGTANAADTRQSLIETLGQFLGKDGMKGTIGKRDEGSEESEDFEKRGMATKEQRGLEVDKRDIKEDLEMLEKQIKDDWEMLLEVLSVIKDALSTQVEDEKSEPKPLTAEDLGEEYPKDENSKTWEGA